MLAALAVILGLSLASVRNEQQQLVDDFTRAAAQHAHASVGVLTAQLDALDQDTRMLTDLVEHSRSGEAPDPATERRVWEGAFRALVVVVGQYRTIALVDSSGAIEILASAPTETADTVAALVPHTQRLALEVSAKNARALGKTARLGERSFLLYGTPVRGGRAIVVASDAAIFLGAIGWAAAPEARLFVTDPAGVVWGDCETSGGCRASASGAPPAELDIEMPPPAHSGGRGARTVQSKRIPAVQVTERVDRPTGSWVVTWLASTRALIERNRSMVARVVLTAMAAALAVAIIGTLVLRHQRRAVELEGRLRFAQALASARETSQSIVDNAPLGVLGVSKDARVVLANGFLAERLGPIRIGAPLREAFTEAAGEWGRALQEMLSESESETESASAGGASGTAPALRSITTGAQQFHIRVVPVRDQELGVHAFALIEDLSEIRDLESQLVRAEKLITVGVLAAGIAHEVGSPLAVIRGRAEQVLRAIGDGPRGDDLRVIIKHIDNISSTIRQVLDFSRRQSIERQAVPLETIVERARSLLEWKSAAKKMRIEVSIEEDLPPLAADPDQLQQVFVNLLLNACDASREGDRVLVTAVLTREGRVQIEVVDHGCGIAPEHMNTVFDPFFTTKKRGEGTGLGLPIAASIVRNHGGQINLDSAPGKGTTATVIWPVAAAGTATAGEARAAHA
ncbi:MAG TPA: ATP-binding protein [Polyangia bacterium]|jgi:signal transduction histidine kinase|nr:ATP-binding protein [Polyangia bacterium]